MALESTHLQTVDMGTAWMSAVKSTNRVNYRIGGIKKSIRSILMSHKHKMQKMKLYLTEINLMKWILMISKKNNNFKFII